MLFFERLRERWEMILEQVNSASEHARDMHEVMIEVRRLLLTTLSRKPEEPASFVCVMVDGINPDGALMASAMAGRIKDGLLFLDTHSYVPLTHVRVVVFADLERVSVRQVICGNEVATCAAGECPVAYFDEWQVGVRLRVACERRAA